MGKVLCIILTVILYVQVASSVASTQSKQKTTLADFLAVELSKMLRRGEIYSFQATLTHNYHTQYQIAEIESKGGWVDLDVNVETNLFNVVNSARKKVVTVEYYDRKSEIATVYFFGVNLININSKAGISEKEIKSLSASNPKFNVLLKKTKNIDLTHYLFQHISDAMLEITAGIIVLDAREKLICDPKTIVSRIFYYHNKFLYSIIMKMLNDKNFMLSVLSHAINDIDVGRKEFFLKPVDECQYTVLIYKNYKRGVSK
ncbi:MAG: hypothetical protein QXT86_11265 [Archaeoglobaceae archaeon]